MVKLVQLINTQRCKCHFLTLRGHKTYYSQRLGLLSGAAAQQATPLCPGCPPPGPGLMLGPGTFLSHWRESRYPPDFSFLEKSLSWMLGHQEGPELLEPGFILRADCP